MKMKKWLSVLLAVVLLVSAVPMTASAAGEELRLDTPLTVIPETGSVTATFTPAESGLYAFTASDVDLSQPATPDMEIYVADEYVDFLTSIPGKFYYVYNLTGGITYTVEFTDGQMSTAGYAVTVSKEATKELTMDEPVTAIPGQYLAFVTFTPETDDQYLFASESFTDSDPCLWDFVDEDGDPVHAIKGEYDDYDGWEFWVVFELKAGVTYTLALYDYGETTDGFTVSVGPFYAILEQPTATDPSVVASKEADIKSYQWHGAKATTAPLTPDSDCVDYYNDYNEENGLWIGYKYSSSEEEGQYNFGVVDLFLNSGETVTVTSTDPIVEANLYGWRAGADGVVTVVDEHTVKMLCTEAMGYSIEILTEGDAGTFKVELTTLELGDAIAGQTTDTLTEYERDESYACVVTYKDGSEVVSNFVKMVPVIIEQPTAADPSVAVTFPEQVKKYQWYTLDANMVPLSPDRVVDSSDYNEETDEWAPEPMSQFELDKYEYCLFDITLEEGETLYVETADAIHADYSYISGNMVSAGAVPINANAVTLTAPSDDSYSVWIITDSDTSTFKVRVGSIELGDAIDDQTEAALTKYENGGWYACKVTYEDGTELVSDYVQIVPAIIKQPTATDPSVEVNFPEEVEGYQWHEINKIPITDKNTTPAEADGLDIVSGTYDSETDTWIPGNYEGMKIWFQVELKKDDKLYVEVVEGELVIMAMGIGVSTSEPITPVTFEETENSGVYVATATEDAAYVLVGIAMGEVVSKVWAETTEPMDGQTTASLTKREVGAEYICEVLLKDGSVLMSDSFIATDVSELAIKVEGVDTTDKAALEEALKEIEELLKADDLTDEEKKLLTELQTKVKAAIAALAPPDDGKTDDKTDDGAKDPGAADDKVDSPDMGDHSDLRLWMAVLLVAGLSVMVLVGIFAKKRMNK